MLYFWINVSYGKKYIDNHYSPSNGDIELLPKVFQQNKFELRQYLDSLGISYPEKIISIPDFSPNQTLLYLNLTGWTDYLGKIDRNKLQDFINLGANYLLNTDSSYMSNPSFDDIKSNKIGDFNNQLSIYDLRSLRSQ